MQTGMSRADGKTRRIAGGCSPAEPGVFVLLIDELQRQVVDRVGIPVLRDQLVLEFDKCQDDDPDFIIRKSEFWLEHVRHLRFGSSEINVSG